KISKNVTRKASVTRASVAELPALNGQGVSISRVDLPRGGSVPMHTHPGSEILMVRQGSVKAGFRTSAKKDFVKTLKKDDIMNGDDIDLDAVMDMLNMDCDYVMRSDEESGC
nr:auxin-binding protein ABP19a-like [Tanacetum cinerariifolium]